MKQRDFDVEKTKSSKNKLINEQTNKNDIAENIHEFLLENESNTDSDQEQLKYEEKLEVKDPIHISTAIKQDKTNKNNLQITPTKVKETTQLVDSPEKIRIRIKNLFERNIPCPIPIIATSKDKIKRPQIPTEIKNKNPLKQKNKQLINKKLNY
jgi:hypothetical protein